MTGFKINAEKVGEFDELDLNAFSIKPDALIYFTIAQIVGIIPKGIEQGRNVTDILMMKSLLIDDLQDLCEAQNYLKPDLVDEQGNKLDPYYKLVNDKEKELGIDSTTNNNEYWQKMNKVARLKFSFLNKRVFSSSAKFKELQY